MSVAQIVLAVIGMPGWQAVRAGFPPSGPAVTLPSSPSSMKGAVDTSA